MSKVGVLSLALHAQEPWEVHGKSELESNQMRGFRKEEGLERGGARGAGSLSKLLQHPDRRSGSWVREPWSGFEVYFGEE